MFTICIFVVPVFFSGLSSHPGAFSFCNGSAISVFSCYRRDCVSVSTGFSADVPHYFLYYCQWVGGSVWIQDEDFQNDFLQIVFREG